MKITEKDDISHAEALRIGAIIGVAAIRGGVLTTRQQKTIDRILKGAKAREDKIRAEKAAGK